MKFKDKFGNDVECTPEEYKILMSNEVVDKPLNVEKVIAPVKVQPKVVVVPIVGTGKLSGGSSGHKWTRKELKLLRQNSDKPIEFLMNLFPKRSMGAIRVQLVYHGSKSVHKHNFSSVKKPIGWNLYSEAELQVLRDNHTNIDKCVELLPNHTRGSITFKLQSLGLYLHKDGSYDKHSQSRIENFLHGNVWTGDELKILRDNLNDLSKAKELLAGKHSVGSINVYASKLRRSLMNIATVKNSGKPYKRGENHGNHDRMKFMNSRADYYMRLYPNWNRDKAFVQASADWKNGKANVGSVSPVVDEQFVFKVVKFDFEAQKYVVVNIFSSEDEAKACLEECKVGDKIISGGAQYSIVKVLRGSKDDIGGNENE